MLRSSVPKYRQRLSMKQKAQFLGIDLKVINFARLKCAKIFMIRSPSFFASWLLALPLLASAQADAPPSQASGARLGGPAGQGAPAGINYLITRQASVTAVATRGTNDNDPSNDEGVTSPVVVRIAETPGADASVGVMQQYFDAVGDDLSASAWIAGICAAQTQDRMLSDYEILVKISGRVSGPSMGMLLTSTMMALMKGDAILPGVTMTGAVNPDGTVGPVGGIDLKMKAAKKAGFTRFGYPVGDRMAWSRGTGMTDIDLQEQARALGIEAVEIQDIYDAYFLLTGKQVERHAPLSESEMEISTDMAGRVRGAAMSLRADAERRNQATGRKLALLGLDKLKKMLGEKTQSSSRANLQLGRLTGGYDFAKEAVKESERAEREGSFASAYLQAMIADIQSRVAEASIDLMTPVFSLDLEEMLALHQNQAQATQQKLDSLRLQLRSLVNKQTVGGKVDGLHSYLHYGEARVHHYSGLKRQQRIKELRKAVQVAFAKLENSKTARLTESEAATFWQLVDTLVESTTMGAIAEGRAESANRWAAFATESGGPAPDNPKLFDQLGRAYGSAASAGLAYFQSLILERVAQESNASSMAEAKRVFAAKEPHYPLIQDAAEYAEFADVTNDVLAAESLPLERFAVGLYSYVGISTFISKYYTFSMRTPSEQQQAGGKYEQPDEFKLTNRKALGRALDGARRRVLEEAGAVKELIGFVPESIKLNYDLATSSRDGSDEDRLMALRSYWRCNVLCYLTRMIAAKPASPATKP